MPRSCIERPEGVKYRDVVSFMASPKLAKYLDDVLETGLHGTTHAGVARNLVQRRIEDLIAARIIELRGTELGGAEIREAEAP